MIKNTLLASILFASLATKATCENVFEMDEHDLQSEIQDAIDETNDRNEDIKWFNRATSKETPGWFKGDIYQAKSQSDKMLDLWSMIEADANGPDSPADLMWEEFDNFFKQRANGSFCQKSDEMKKRRLKTSHTQGVVAKIQWESTDDHEFSGLFQQGSDFGIIRMSEASNLNDASTGLTPSIALKFLVDDFRSVNLFGMVGFKPSTSWNFFNEPLSNRLKNITKDDHIEYHTFRTKLVEASERPFATGLADMARTFNNGTVLHNRHDRDEIKVPYQLQYRKGSWELPAEDEFRTVIEDATNGPWYEQLKQIPSGANLYTVWALTNPDTTRDWVKIANINLMTPLVTSNFGDTRLHFQHRKINRDRKFWEREWRDLNEDPFFDRDLIENQWQGVPEKDSKHAWPEDAQKAKDKYIGQVENWGCPFGWLLELLP